MGRAWGGHTVGRKGKGWREETKIKDTEGRNEEGGERKLEGGGGRKGGAGRKQELNDELVPV